MRSQTMFQVGLGVVLMSRSLLRRNSGGDAEQRQGHGADPQGRIHHGEQRTCR